MGVVKPMLNLSKRWMNPTGGEIVDKMISDIPIFTSAVYSNETMTIHRILNDSQKSVELLIPHITQPELRGVYSERLVAFKTLITCMNQGECGFRAYTHYLISCINPCRTLFTSLKN